MPNPTISQVHVSAALTNISVAYSQRANFVANRIFPTIPVMKQGDQYFVWDRQDLLRSDAGPRAPGDESRGGGVRLSTNTYHCNRIAWHEDVDDPTRANADPALNLDADATEHVTEQIELRRELDFFSDFFTTGVWDGASSSTDMTGQANPASTSSNFRQWNDIASTPIEDIDGEATAMVQNTGKRPTGLLIGAQVWTALKHHPDVLDRIKYTERGIVTTDLLASLLDLEQVDVAWATNDTSVEGSSAASYAFAGGRGALLYYKPMSPGPRKPSAGYCFVWTGAGSPRQGARIKRYRLERNESDRIEGEMWFDDAQVASDLGVFFATAVSS